MSDSKDPEQDVNQLLRELAQAQRPCFVRAENVNFSRLPDPAPSTAKPQLAADSSHSKDVIVQAIKGEYAYAKLGLILGLASIIGGVVMGLHGVEGHTSWTASFLGLNSQINDAAPGVILFVVGLFMIRATKPKVDLKDLKG